MTSEHSLVLVMGVPGSGKSTLARQVVKRTNWVYLDNNFIIDPFFPDTRDSVAHAGLRPKFYEVMYNIAARNLELGNSVLLDAPHVRPMKDPLWWKQMRSLAEDAGATLKVVRCHCSEATLRSRVEARAEQRDVAKLRDWQRFLREQPIRGAIPLDHIEIDTDVEVDACDKVLRYVSGTE